MDAGIYTETDELISKHIREGLPGYETSKVSNRLLDGTWHVQTVGDGARTLHLVVFAGGQGKEKLDLMEAEGSAVKVVVLDKIWMGYIRERIFWQETALNYYRGEIHLLVTSEEDL